MPKFKPKPGQIDYSNVRWAPVINCIVMCGDEILLVKRSKSLKFYPNYWNGISGFLDDKRSLIKKIKDELREETGIKEKDIILIKVGQIFDLDQPRYKKTWIVHPVLIKVKNCKLKIDWEAEEFRWVKLNEIKKFRLIPGFDKVMDYVL